MPLTISTYSETDTLTDFPVLVKLSSARIDYATTCETDIRFYDSTGNHLYKETEKWNEAGDSFIWVKVPIIHPGVTNTIWAYFGSTNAVADSKTNVWNSGYEGVWHLNEASGTVYDSTSNAINSSTQSETYNVTGQINGGGGFNGSSNYLDFGTGVGTIASGGITISSWVQGASIAGALRGMIEKRYSDGVDNVNYGFVVAASGKLEFYYMDAGRTYHVWDSTSTITALGIDDGDWHSLAVSFTYGTTASIALYVDGVAKGGSWVSGDGTADPITGVGQHLVIGSEWYPSAASSFFLGNMDDCRISGSQLSSSWIKAEYLAGTDALITYGATEAR